MGTPQLAVRLVLNTGLIAFLFTAGTLWPTPTTTHAAPLMQRETLPTGVPWTLVLNGFETTLTFESQDEEGNITGLLDDDPITGFWDQEDQKVTFIRVVSPTPPDPNRMQVFTGYLFETDTSCPYGEGGDFCFWLTGSYVAFKDAGRLEGTSAQRNTFGWFAYLFGIA